MATMASILSSVRDALYWTPDWLSGVAVLLIAVIAALLVHRIIFVVFGRAFGERHPVLRTIVWQTKGPLALALVAFALAAALQTTPFGPPVSLSLQREYPTALPHARAETVQRDAQKTDEDTHGERPARTAAR